MRPVIILGTGAPKHSSLPTLFPLHTSLRGSFLECAAMGDFLIFSSDPNDSYAPVGKIVQYKSARIKPVSTQRYRLRKAFLYTFGLRRALKSGILHVLKL